MFVRLMFHSLTWKWAGLEAVLQTATRGRQVGFFSLSFRVLFPEALLLTHIWDYFLQILMAVDY